MKIKVMIAEDEQFALEELKYLLKNEDDIILCPSATTGEQLIELYFKHKPDVLFLDIEIPIITGVDAAKEILRSTDDYPLFVFTTAYDCYAIEAFEVEAIDYLLKPFDFIRLQQALKRIRTQFKRKHSFSKQIENKQNKLLINDGDKMIVVSPDEIMFAVTSNRLIEIHTIDNVIKSNITLQELEERLTNYSFFRTHRSYLVNLNYIEEVEPWFNGAYNIILKGKKDIKIPVSRNAKKHFFDLFTNH